jgi:sorbitol/mannitol transport system permease protein
MAVQLKQKRIAGKALALIGLVAILFLMISPFFVMPTVNALMWKNMMMNPIYGATDQSSN